jgi:preprotein translocase subunit SecG
MELFLTIVYILLCVSLIISVLLQSGKSAGLSGSIAGGAESLFGKKKGIDDKLARYTQILAFAFLAMSVIMIVFFTLGLKAGGKCQWRTW